MRSTCSWVASPSCTSAQRLGPERAPAAVDEEARPVGRVDHVAPHRAAELARRLERGLARLLPGHHLDELHRRRGVEEVHADHALGPGDARRDLGHAERRRVGRQHAVVAHHLGDALEQRALELERLRAPPRSRCRRRRARPPPPRPRPARPHLPPAAPSRPRVRAARRSRPARAECLGVGIVDERARPRRRGELRDAGAHRAGPEDRDDGHYEGTSALSPVSARPMISFWICEVPS